MAAELDDADNNGCVGVDGGEGTSADGVGSASVGCCSESPWVHVESEESAMDVDVVDVGLLVFRPPGEWSTLSDTQKFQLLIPHEPIQAWWG